MKWIKKRKKKEQIEEEAEEKVDIANDIVEYDSYVQVKDRVVSTPSF